MPHHDPDNPFAPPKSPLGSEPTYIPSSASYSVLYFLAEATILLGVSSLTLDLGQTFRVACISVLAHTSIVLLILIRRGSRPTAVDAFVVKWGLIFVFIAALMYASILGRI